MIKRPRNQLEATSSSFTTLNLLLCSVYAVSPCTFLRIMLAVLYWKRLQTRKIKWFPQSWKNDIVYVCWHSNFSKCCFWITVFEITLLPSYQRSFCSNFVLYFCISLVRCLVLFAFRYCYSIWTKYMDKKYWSRMYCTSCLPCTPICNAALLFFIAFFVLSFTSIFNSPVGLNIASMFFSVPYLLSFCTC